MVDQATDMNKKFYQSKTLGANVIMLVAAFVPSVQEWISSNPEGAAAVVTLTNVVLRWVTTKTIVI